MHDDFLVPDITAKTLEYVHITEKEKDVAEDLLQKGYLVKEECRNMEKIKLQNFYELKIPQSRSVNTLESGVRCKKYQISSMVGTNAFLGEKVDNVGDHVDPASHDTFCSMLTLNDRKERHIMTYNATYTPFHFPRKMS